MSFINGVKSKGAWWFRVFGIGISWKDVRLHRLLFSERNGYYKGLKIGNWIFHYLKKEKVYDYKRN
jgi:hypothetical protein